MLARVVSLVLFATVWTAGALGTLPSVAGAQDDDDIEGDGTPADVFEPPKSYKPIPPGTKVTFNLEDAELQDLVRLISNITGRRFILSGKLKGIQASVQAPSQVTAGEAYRAFLSILELNGLTVMPSGPYLKIVETAGIENRPVPTYTGEGQVPSEDRYMTYLKRLDHVSANEVAGLLGRFKTRDGNVGAYEPTNMVIITDTGSNIQRMLRIVGAVDQPSGGEQVWVEPIHNADAATLAETVTQLFAADPNKPKKAGEDGETGAVTGVSKIIPDDRSNSLIIVGTEKGYLQTLEIIRRFDIALEGEGRAHVLVVENGDAEEMAATLQNLVGRTSGTGGGGGGGRRGGQQQTSAQPSATAVFENEVGITAHKASNALVVTATPRDYSQIRRMVKELDTPRKQVYIEAVILDLRVSRNRDLGIAYHGGASDLPTEGSLGLLGFEAGKTASPGADGLQTLLTGLALGVRGPVIEESQQLVGRSVPGFGLAIKAQATTEDVNILSTPHLIATDNVEAEINIGENVPLQTSQLPALGIGGLPGAGGAGGAGGLGGFPGAIPRQDVGTILRLTPHLSDDERIRIDIEEEISSVGAPDTTGNAGVRSISRTTARTEVVVGDQQTVVIGGLIRDQVTSAERKIPFLGDLPLVGVLFRDTKRTKEKRNLILFLTPYIIRDAADMRAIYERKMRERQEFLDRYFVFTGTDYKPPVDYARTRGLLAEMFLEIGEDDARRAFEASLAIEDKKEHLPSKPIGASDLVINPEESGIPDEG